VPSTGRCEANPLTARVRPAPARSCDAGFRLWSDRPASWELTGEIDSANAGVLAMGLTSACRHHDATRLSFAELEFIDVTGMRAIAETAAHEPRRRVVISNADAVVRYWKLAAFRLRRFRRCLNAVSSALRARRVAQSSTSRGLTLA
jgi:hypothetical protein